MLRLRSFLLLLVATGCDSSPLGGTPDLSTANDLAPPDLAMLSDLIAPDFALPDLTLPSPLDFAMASDAALACGGGYLDSDMAAACPLACSPKITPVADEGAMHVPFGTPVAYAHNPPASGPHWPSPAPWGPYGATIAREWWVHNLEHGGVVLLYNCPWPADAGTDSDGGTRPPNDCPDVIAALEMLYSTTAWPDGNSWCGVMGAPTHILVTPDPLLPTRVAAVAWDWAYTDDHVDLAALKCFIAARINRGPEFLPCF